MLFLTADSFVHAGELEITGYIKPDQIRGNNYYLILNDDGNAKGRIKVDSIWPLGSDRYLIIDKDGNESGRIKPDYLNKGRYNNIETIKDD